MNSNFHSVRRQLNQGIAAVLACAGVFLLLALGAAILGLPHAVESSKSASWACGYAAAVLAATYILAHLLAATIHVVRWLLDRNRLSL